MTEAGVDTNTNTSNANVFSAKQRAHHASRDTPKFSQQRFSGDGAASNRQRRVSNAVETEVGVLTIDAADLC